MNCCTDCDFKSQITTNVRNHVEAHHVGPGRIHYTCNFCGRTFKSKNSFQSHKSRSKGRCGFQHSSQFPEQIRFILMLSVHPVNKHVKLNRTIELTFEFEDFEAAVNSKVVKDLDGIIGTWGCSDCPYSNLYLGNLKRHIETHHVRSAGYNCPTCLKFCATKNALRLHMKRYNHRDRARYNDNVAMSSLPSVKVEEGGSM